ncbi:MAG TPA: GAF domain-containing protein [Anaerolineales bacterium]|nr:GAF domain-containing protein [Anaerolineales bacterium]
MKFNLQAFLQIILKRTGGWYIAVIVAAVQLIAFISTALATYFIQNNAQLSTAQFAQVSRLSIDLVLIGDALMIAWAYFSHREANELLDYWSRNKTPMSNPEKELQAWKQVNSLPLRFAVATLLVAIVGEVVPILYQLYFIIHATFDQTIYTFEGSLVVTLASGLLSTLLLDQFMYPARKILLPKTFEAQRLGVTGFRLWIRFLAIAMVLIAVITLLLAPIGYHHTALANQNKGNAAQVLRSFQIQAGLAILVAIIYGLIFVWLLTRSVLGPVEQIAQALYAVERGELSRRTDVIASDEIGELAIYFNRMTENLHTLHETLESQVRERTARLKATVGVSRAVSAILDVDRLIEQVVNVISEEFGYYYVALFLLDPTEKWANLRAATGDAGRVLIQNKHRLEIGGKSMVGSAISTRQPRVAMSTSEEPVRFDNPLLPYTRSEIALPLISGDRVLGALDAQSTHEGAFGPDDVETLQTMANQVAIALENARLFQESLQSLQEMRAIQQQYLVNSWKAISDKTELGYTIGELDSSEEPSKLDVPLTLRDQMIGEISLSGDDEWTPEEKSMIEAVATQAALALENARLVEESQSTARREHLVSEITGKIWSSNTVDGILQTAIKELGRALDTDEVTIELKVEQPK